MLEVMIIGAGGWGREVLAQMQGDTACGKEWLVKGFLDNRLHVLDGLGCDTPIVGSPLDYSPRPGEAFVCAVGAPHERARYVQPLLSQGGLFIEIRTEASMGPRVHLGQGCFLSRRVQLSPDVWIGDFTNVHTQTVIGHDVRIGNYAQIGAMVFIGGGARIGHLVTVYPHATVLPGIQIGDGATVGAGAVVLKDVPPGATVFGNPARVIFQAETR